MDPVTTYDTTAISGPCNYLGVYSAAIIMDPVTNDLHSTLLPLMDPLTTSI